MRIFLCLFLIALFIAWLAILIYIPTLSENYETIKEIL